MLASALAKSVLSTSTKLLCTRSISLQGGPLCAIYPKEFVEPSPHPGAYWTGMTGHLRSKEFKAASNSHTYSNFYDHQVNKFEQMLLKKGKAYMAQRIMQTVLENIKLAQVEAYHKAESEEEKQKIELDPIKVFNCAIENIKPQIGVQGYRLAAMSYQVPHPLRPRKQVFMTHKWILDSVRLRGQSVPFVDRLTKEIMAAYVGQGAAMKKKQALHKLAEANRAYAHYRWEDIKPKPKLRGRRAAKAKTSKFGR